MSTEHQYRADIVGRLIGATCYAPDRQELTELVHTISHRVAGFLERDEENSYLNLEEGDEDPMQQVLGCSVGYRIAIEPQQGRKLFTLQTIPAWEDDDRFAQVAKESVINSKRPTAMAPRTSSSSRWIHCQAGCLGAETESKPNPVPRRIRGQQQTPGRCDAG